MQIFITRFVTVFIAGFLLQGSYYRILVTGFLLRDSDYGILNSYYGILITGYGFSASASAKSFVIT